MKYQNPTLKQIIHTVRGSYNGIVFVNTDNETFPEEFRCKCINLNELFMLLHEADKNHPLLERGVENMTVVDESQLEDKLTFHYMYYAFFDMRLEAEE